MLKKWQGVGSGFAGITIGGSGDGQPLPLVIVTILVLAMALITVFDAVRGGRGGIDTSKKVPFKCTSCGKIVQYTIADLQKMQKPGEFGPMGPMGPTGPGGPTAPGAPVPPGAPEGQAPAPGVPPMGAGPGGAGPGVMGPMMGPMTLECPECHKKTLTQAVECPKCQEVFVMQMDPAQNLFNDKCPKCGTSYAKAWQEKYRKTQGE